MCYHLGHRNKNRIFSISLKIIYAVICIIIKIVALFMLPFNSKMLSSMVIIRGNEFFQKKIMQRKKE
jgi:hypothetical protein